MDQEVNPAHKDPLVLMAKLELQAREVNQDKEANKVHEAKLDQPDLKAQLANLGLLDL